MSPEDSAAPPAARKSLARRWRWVAAAGVLVLLALVLLYNRHALADIGKTDFADVQLTRGLVMNKNPQAPFSGTLLVRGEDISVLGSAVFAETRLQEWTSADTQGLILEVSVAAGQLSGEATLYADLRVSEMAQELGSGLGFLLAKWFAPRQKVASAYFAEGRLNGTVAVWQPGGSGLALHKFAQAEFKDNEMHGTVLRYYKNGAVMSEMTFTEGLPTGLQREYYDSSEILREFQRTETGSETKAFYRNGQLRVHEISEQGQTVSKQTWFPDGSKKSLHRYADGQLLTGKGWYSTGALAFDSSEEDPPLNPADGTIREYHDNGALRSEYQVVNGVASGPFAIYYDNEKPWEKGSFVNGERDGRHQKWWKNGKQALDATWKLGTKEGKYQRWYASGELWEAAEYREGVLVGAYLKRWKNGETAHEYQYDKGKPEGVYRTFYDNGQPRLEATYKNGQLHGAYKNWLRDGKVYELATYDAGIKVQSSLDR